MGYKCSFLDDASYTAQDVNDALGHIAGGGAAFTDTGDTLDDFNTTLSGITGAGTQLCGCAVTESGGVYKIGAGTCFMEDGSQITFDSDGYVIEPIENKKSYVYVSRNQVGNTIDVVVSETAGGDGTVPLAEIAAGGGITDTRSYARAKVLLLAAQASPSRSFTVNRQLFHAGDSINVGYSDWRYIIVHNLNFAHVGSDDYSCTYLAMDLSDGESHEIPIFNTGSGSNATTGAHKSGNLLVFDRSAEVNMTFEVI
ncbi:MAG: hypothetical protein PUE13_05435 [Clostridiales bacterium]|nr:hypothetical protein [Clostridiales bacterium]